jgi:hypothetical protein
LTAIEHRLLDLSGIAEHVERFQRELGLHLDVSPEQSRQQAADAGDRIVEIEHARLEQLFTAEGQQLARDRSRALSRAPDFLDVGAGRMIRRHFAQGELRVPAIAVSALFKSCAMPPARRPIASIFCDCRN